MYCTHRCSVHVASCVSIYGYGTPPPQDRARTARGLMKCIYIQVMCMWYCYYLYNGSWSWGSPGQCPLAEFFQCSPLVVVSPAAAGPGDFSSVAAGCGVGVCPARSALSSVAGLAGVLLSALPPVSGSSAGGFGTAERSSGCRSL